MSHCHHFNRQSSNIIKSAFRHLGIAFSNVTASPIKRDMQKRVFDVTSSQVNYWPNNIPRLTSVARPVFPGDRRAGIRWIRENNLRNTRDTRKKHALSVGRHDDNDPSSQFPESLLMHSICNEIRLCCINDPATCCKHRLGISLYADHRVACDALDQCVFCDTLCSESNPTNYEESQFRNWKCSRRKQKLNNLFLSHM